MANYDTSQKKRYNTRLSDNSAASRQWNVDTRQSANKTSRAACITPSASNKKRVLKIGLDIIGNLGYCCEYEAFRHPDFMRCGTGRSCDPLR
jgi:hypothetical protein